MYFLPFANCSNDGGDPAAGAGGTDDLTTSWPCEVLYVALLPAVPEDEDAAGGAELVGLVDGCIDDWFEGWAEG